MLFIKYVHVFPMEQAERSGEQKDIELSQIRKRIWDYENVSSTCLFVCTLMVEFACVL